MPDPRDIYAAKEEALEADALEHAYNVLLSNCEGLLCFDDAEIQIKFVFDHADGRIIASIPTAQRGDHRYPAEQKCPTD